MALALPPAIRDIENHANTLLQDFNQQGQGIHQIAFRQKEIGRQIEVMIAKFDKHEVMRKPKDTIAILLEVKSSFEAVKKSVNMLDEEEKEISCLIQDIIQRQGEGDMESGRIQKDINLAQERSRKIQDDIYRTREYLGKMEDELNDLKGKVRAAEEELESAKALRIGMAILTGLTLGIAAFTLVIAEDKVKNAIIVLNNHRELHAYYQNNLRSQQASLRNYEKEGLKLQKQQQQNHFELKELATILSRLKPPKQDTAQYRKFLVNLAKDFFEVNVYIELLVRDLEEVELTHAEGRTPDESLNSTVSSHASTLNEQWNTAKVQPAIKMTLSLHDSNNAQATLDVIKSLNLPDRDKRSLGFLGVSSRCQG